MKTHRMRRTAAVVAAVAIAGTVLAGCAGSGGSSSTGGKVTLTVQVWADATQAKEYQKDLDTFNTKNPDITAKLEWMDVGSYQDKLNTKFAAGDPPDVFFLVGNWIGEYASRGALLDLSTVSDNLDLSPIPQDLLLSGQLDGKTYGVPTGLSALGFVYNRDVVAKAGLKMPDDSTWSWDDFATFNKDIYDKTGTYGTGFYIPWTPLLSTYARQRGEDFYTKDGKLGISAKTVEDYFQMTVDMRASGAYAPSGALENQGTSTADSPLGKDVIASQIIPSNVFPDFNSALKGKLDLLRLPGETDQDRRGMQVSPTLFWAAAAQGKNTAAAAKLMDYLTNDADSFATRTTLLGVPVNPDVAEKVGAGLSGDQKTFVDYVQSLLKEDLPPYFLEPAGAGEVANALVSVATEVEFGRMTPKQAADKFISDATAALANAG